MKKIRSIRPYGSKDAKYISLRIPKVFNDLFPWRHVSIEDLPDGSGIVVRPFRIIE